MGNKTETEAWYEELDRSYKSSANLMTRKMNIVVPLLRDGKLLDIGSGSGELISRVAARMTKIVSVEINKSALQMLGEKTSNLENVEIYDALERVSEKEFDCCSMLDVLEHLEDPKEMVEEVCSLLKDDGTYIVTVPNWYDYIFSKVLRLNPYHVTFHSHYGWTKILRDAGFNIELVRSVKWPFFKSSFVAKKFPFWGMCLVFVCKKN